MKTGIRPLWKDILAAVWMGIILPGITLQICVLLRGKIPESAPEIQEKLETTTQYISLLDSKNGSCTTLEINDYLTGVVLAEMPAAFEEEALKSQAVAARTYTVKAGLTGGKHGDGSLCDSPGCCQGYIAEEMYLLGGGIQESVDKVRQSVMDTDHLVLEYEGELIEAVYFSSSGGKTESALAVWGADFPYLQSVESPGEDAGDYQNKAVTMNTEDFQKRLGVQMSGEPTAWFSDVTYTEGGGVEFMVIAGRKFTGVRLRELLNLPSTAFSMISDGDQITITTSGYGHRVGFSQYGANAMAREGRTFREILAYYYPGTTIKLMQ